MSLNLRFLAAFSLLALSPISFADTEDERDALRVEVEQLLQFGRLSIGDIDMIIISTAFCMFNPHWPTIRSIRPRK